MFKYSELTIGQQIALKKAIEQHGRDIVPLDTTEAPSGFMERYGCIEFWYNDREGSTHLKRVKIAQ